VSGDDIWMTTEATRGSGATREEFAALSAEPGPMFPYPVGLAELLAVFRYKPGWSFELRQPGTAWEPWVLYAWTPGAEGTCCDTYLTAAPSVAWQPGTPPAEVRQWWLRWLHGTVRVAEAHISDAWFTVGGARPFDPHDASH
jgi:hypothetical protein